MDLSRPVPFSAGALVAAAVTGVGAALALPDMPGADPSSGVENAAKMFAAAQAHRTGTYVSLVLGVVSSALFLVGLPALLALARRPGRRALLATTAAVVTTLGGLGYVGLNGAGGGSVYTLSSPKVAPATAAQIWAGGTDDELGLGIFALSYFVLLTLGLILLAVALFRARLVPRWVPVLLAVAVVLQGFPSSGNAARLLPLPFYLALAVLGVLALRRSDADGVALTPEPSGVAVPTAGGTH